MDDLEPSWRDTDAAEGTEAVVASACRVVAGRADVHAVHVVTGHRPTYDEVVRYRRYADACGLRLAVIGSGGVTLWRPAACAPRHPAARGNQRRDPSMA